MKAKKETKSQSRKDSKKITSPKFVLKERTNEIVRDKTIVTNLLKVKSEYLHPSWVKRLFEITEDSIGTDEYKSCGLFEFFEFQLAHVYLFCRQLSVLLEFFKIGIVNKSSFGSYRVELIVMLFDRLLDLHNFEFILMTLNAEEYAAVICRIGLIFIILNCYTYSILLINLRNSEYI